MKEEWLFPNAVVPVDVETTAALVTEIKRLIDIIGSMALVQRPWVGLTEAQFLEAVRLAENGNYLVAFVRIQEWLKEQNT